MNKIKVNQEQEVIDQQPEKKQEWLETTNAVSSIKFRLDKQIEGSEYYADLLDRLELAGENDSVEIYIDTVGGNLDGCIAICDAIQNTPATVTGIIPNKAYSAGAFISLCCDNLEVRPYARMMAHSYSGVYAGKDHEINLDYNFNNVYIRKFLSDCCEGFLTEEELNKMFDGKDWWFNAEEIVERLQKRQEYFEEKYAALQRQLQEELDNEN